MSGKRDMTNWVRRVLRRRWVEAEMREELEFHRAERVADLVSRGMSEREAARQARMEFGSVDRYQEECRSALGYRWLDELRADLRYAVRGIRRSPGFSAAAVAILGLAIGTNSVFFTLYNNFVLKPLPIRGVERHFVITGRNAKGHGTGGWTESELRAMRDATSRQIEGLYAAHLIQVLMLAPEQRPVLVMPASGNYFKLLGGSARIGRTFVESEEREPLAVLSDAGWRKLMASDPAAVGKTVRVRSTVFTIAGVMEPEFTGTEAMAPDFWVPSGMREAVLFEPRTSASEGPGFTVLGLVRPGVTFAEAQAALTVVAARFERQEESRVAAVEVRDRSSYLPVDGEVNAVAGMVFTAFLMVLLIACANLANLYLCRAGARTHEIGVRLSLGASRRRIVRQLLTESTLVALLGAAMGLALAALGIGQFQSYLFSSMTGMGISILPVTLDWRVAVYAACLGGLAGAGFGLLPAIEATHPSLTAVTKKENSLFAGRVRPRRLRDLLIGGQVAASLVLLVLAGVLIRNIQRLESVSPGYDLDRVMNMKAEEPSRALLDGIGRVDGVRSVAGVGHVPLYGRMNRQAAVVNGASTAVYFNHVDERYFETLGLRVEHGRGFTRLEAESRARVAVISAATAKKLWPADGGSAAAAVGQTMGLAAAGSYQVVGVVPDVVSQWFFDGPDSTAVYLPAAVGAREIHSAIVRVDGSVGAATTAIKRACAEVGDGSAGCEPVSLRALASVQRFPFQAAAAVSGGLGALALLLTGIGLHGVVSYSVLQRRREIGVRVALGAAPWQVVRRIVGEAWWCVVGGVAVGLPVCLVLSKLAAASVLQIRTFDPASYVAVPCLLAAISVLSCLGPASRAARMDAMRSLREE